MAIAFEPKMSSVAMESANSQEPLDLLKFQLDESVLVKLRGAREIRGKLQGYDQHCNMVLSDAREYLYSEEGNDPRIREIEMIFLRGDSVILMSPISEQ